MELLGRKILTTDVCDITSSNVLDVLLQAIPAHQVNQYQIEYLFNYYRGNQPILQRSKLIRPEINNKTVVNRANEIVSFKVGYLVGEPVQYVGRKTDDTISDDISDLNGFMYIESKDALDKELAEHFTICGTAFRLILPNQERDHDSAPFKLFNLDPANTFVVYHSGIESKPVLGVKIVEYSSPEKRTLYCAYTETNYFEIENGAKIIKCLPNPLGSIPIVEYPANPFRLGAFEIVIPILDAINLTVSDRLNGVQQFIQAIMVIINARIDDETIDKLKAKGAIRIVSESSQPADIKYLVEQLNQSETQVLIEDLYESVLTICGLPNRNGGNSTSDTGAAVIMRDGWSSAEARAKDTEAMFKKSEKQFLRIVLKIIRDFTDTHLKLSDIDIQFTRRNYDNIQSKTQVLIQLLNNQQIDPLLAFTHCGLFADPERAYQQSKKYKELNNTKRSIAEDFENDGNIEYSGINSTNSKINKESQAIRVEA